MSQLIVKDIRLQQIQFQINPDFQVDNKDQPIEIKHNLNIKKEIRDKSVVVQVIIQTPPVDQSGNYPFYFLLIVTGYFELKGEVEETELDQLIFINCPAIIFPYLRETLADLTRRSGFPPLHLQPVNFIKLYREKSEICDQSE